MNVLFTCAGRRNYLIRHFRDALRPDERVYAADADGRAPALGEADCGYEVPRCNDPAYVTELLRLCRDNRVSLLIPLNDLELLQLRRHRSDLMAVGAYPLVSSERVLNICFDKWQTREFALGIGLKCPKTFLTLGDALSALDSGELSFPVVLKPRWGSASIGIEYTYDADELATAYRLARQRVLRTILGEASASDPDRSILIQEQLRGQEYGLDVINDLRGRHRTVFARRKLAMRAGETDRAETVDDPALTEVGRRIGESLGHIGNLDCDVFVTRAGVKLLEMNPRFGGGYPFSHVAGANLPAAIVAWARGDEANPDWLKTKPGVVSAKCDRLVEVTATEGPKELPSHNRISRRRRPARMPQLVH